MDSALNERCKRSRELIRQLLARLRTDRPERKRFILSRGAIAVAGQIHMGIVTLAEQGKFTPAFVLLRPLFESGLTSWWLIYAADSADVQRIWQFQGPIPPDSEDIPGLMVKIEQLASRGPYTNLVKLFKGPGAQGKWMHKLAHASAPLLKLHDGPQAFNAEAMASALNIADTFLLLAVGASVAIYDDTGDLEQFVIDRRQAIMVEQQGKSPPDDPDPWRSYPCTIPDDWDT
jgi:hypothetical protein